MNEIIVPIDITQEEKSVLAVFSLRQFFLVVPMGFAMIAFIMWGHVPFMNGLGDFIVRVIMFAVVEGVALALAYFKLDKYEMYLSDYLKVRWKFSRSQKVYQSL